MPIELTEPERLAIRKLTTFAGRAGQRALRRRFLAEVDRETPGLPSAERDALANLRYTRHMQALGRKRA